MRDLLVEIGSRPGARRLIARLGLPLPLPRRLARRHGPWEVHPLADRTVVVGGEAGGATVAIAKTVVACGANALVAGGDMAAFRDLGEAYGRPAAPIDLGALPENVKVDAAVFDASGIDSPAGLKRVYDFFRPLCRVLKESGRAVVLGRPPGRVATATRAAAQAALDGFVRSLAKEVGRRGATAHLLFVEPGAEGRIEPVLRFVLSARSAFVTGQTITIDARVSAAPEPSFVRSLDRKVALVTGAARGIGEATARRLAEEGAHVICLDRPADDTAAGQVAQAVGGSLLSVDLATDDASATIAKYVRDRFGGVDVVVHNAGVTRDKTLARMEPDMWSAAIGVNLMAPIAIDEALVTAGLLREGGRLVFLSSVSGIAGNAGQTNYAASKAGVIGYVRRRAGELAALRVTVNAVAPGFIETRLTAAMPRLVREGGRRLSALGQGGLPVDVAEVITFLASPGAAGVTGAVLRVCGGALIGA